MVRLDLRAFKEREAQMESQESQPPNRDLEASMACLGSEGLRDPKGHVSVLELDQNTTALGQL